MVECVSIGYIKAKFALDKTKRLSDCLCFDFLQDFDNVRFTDNFAYLAIGHEILIDNDLGRSILQEIEDLHGKVTRLDFAVDVRQKFDLPGYYAMLKELYTAKGKKGSLGLPALITSPNGDTVYVGRRSSARMLRAYDKRAEILAKKKVDIDFDLTRFEIEIKRDRVAKYRYLFMSGNTLAILNDIASRYHLPWLCDHPEKILPRDTIKNKSSALGFVERFKKVIRIAYLEDKVQFADIIGVEL